MPARSFRIIFSVASGDVSALAGFCNTTGGERVAFAFLMNRVNPSGARALQDRMTVALARYDAP